VTEDGDAMRTTLRLLTLALIVALPACAVDCSGDERPPPVSPAGDVVGGPCSAPEHCVERLCLTSGNFPGGTCSVACESDLDCPSGTWCIDTDSGVCLLACTHPSQCRAGYDCSDENRRNAAGTAFVCIQ